MQKENGSGRFFMVLAAAVLMIAGVFWLSQTGSVGAEPMFYESVPYMSIYEAE